MSDVLWWIGAAILAWAIGYVVWLMVLVFANARWR